MSASSYQAYQIVNSSITCHAWNKDRTQGLEIALCPNSNEVHIYEWQESGWTVQHVLAEHDKLVTGIDWAPQTNRLVTCSQDRNAYVWTWDAETSQWKPTLVLLRINRAATAVKWSPREDKFAVASGAKCISVCYFEKSNDWWVSKHLKKPLKSTVLSLDWHPDNVLIAAGSSDKKARVFSSFIKGVDEKPEAGIWGENYAFNAICAEISSDQRGWVHAMAFSPSGFAVAFATHDSSIVIFYPETQQRFQVRSPFLPYLSMCWLTETSIVAAGHDCTPVLFAIVDNSWQFVTKLDQGVEAKAAKSSAFDKFKQMDSRAQTSGDTNLSSVHQNSITCIYVTQRNNGRVDQFATSGLDGKIVLWNVDVLEQSLGGLKI